MKIVMREWWKDKTACCLMMAWFALEVIYIALNAWVIMLIAKIFDDSSQIQYNLIVLGGICVIQVIITALTNSLQSIAIHHCFSALNNRYADKMLDSDVVMFTKFSIANITTSSEFMWRVTAVGKQMIGFVLNIITIIVTMYSMYVVGGPMIIPVIIIYLIGAMIMKLLYKQYDKLDQQGDAIKRSRNQELENIINGFAEVRTFNTAEHHRDQIHGYNYSILKCFTKRSKINGILGAVINVIDGAGILIVIIYSLKMITAGAMTIANGMSLTMYVFRIIDPLLNILNFVDELSQNLSMSKEYDKIINYVNTDADNGTIEMDGFSGEIELNNVCFSYNKTGSALRNINMTFKKGQKVGICGESGGGKSTLFKLINRFYDVNSGSIRIDGIDIKDLTRGSYRKHISSVHQENTIFPGTIGENILYANKDASQYDLMESCKKAKLYDFIMTLPERFNTTVGPRGLKLSGGQKQRIALARLFICDRNIILLDEATSALDNDSETFIQDAIDGLQGKTIITIAHRLSTIRNSDIIYVLGSNGVIESGTHEELMKLKGVYSGMNK